MSYILQGAGPAFYFTVVPIPRLQELWGVGLPVGVGCFPPTGGVFQKEHTVWLHCSPSAIVFFESSSPIPCVGLLDLNMWAP